MFAKQNYQIKLAEDSFCFHLNLSTIEFEALKNCLLLAYWRLWTIIRFIINIMSAHFICFMRNRQQSWEWEIFKKKLNDKINKKAEFIKMILQPAKFILFQLLVSNKNLIGRKSKTIWVL